VSLSERFTALRVRGEFGYALCIPRGWMFDETGACTEPPFEPKQESTREAFHHTAYPVQEYCGLVFAYLGPAACADAPSLGCARPRRWYASAGGTPRLGLQLAAMPREFVGPGSHLLSARAKDGREGAVGPEEPPGARALRLTAIPVGYREEASVWQRQRCAVGAARSPCNIP
jgi:hypothetical protein